MFMQVQPRELLLTSDEAYAPMKPGASPRLSVPILVVSGDIESSVSSGSSAARWEDPSTSGLGRVECSKEGDLPNTWMAFSRHSILSCIFTKSAPKGELQDKSGILL